MPHQLQHRRLYETQPWHSFCWKLCSCSEGCYSVYGNHIVGSKIAHCFSFLSWL